jgi:charged multivesicular body protein 2A
MAFLFGGARPSGQDSLKDFQRQIQTSARGMEREAMRLDRKEKLLQAELTKCGKDGKMEQATRKAKEMVRLRAHRSRLFKLNENMTGLANQLQIVNSSQKIQETIGQTMRMLQGLNARFDASSVARMLAEFEKQNVLMANKQEIVDDTLDNAFEVDGELDATSEAVLEVLEAAGLDTRAMMAKAPGGGGAREQDEDLDERLQRLRMA